VCSALSRPVNVLVYGALMRHPVEDFAQAGVARLSLGGALASEAYATLAEQASAMKAGGQFDMFGKRREAQATVRAIIRK
jgi:2-methylisocitrate lyase-like PEP mutase family enzyme